MNKDDKQSTKSPNSALCYENFNSATQSSASGSNVGEKSDSEYSQRMEGLSHWEDVYQQQQNGIKSENMENKLKCQQNDFANNCWEIVGVRNVNKTNAKFKVQQILRNALPDAEVPDDQIEICYIKESQAKDGSIIWVRLCNLSTMQHIISEKMKSAQSFTFAFGASESRSGNDASCKAATITVRQVHSEHIARFMKAEAAKEKQVVDQPHSTDPHPSVRPELKAGITVRQAQLPDNVALQSLNAKDYKLLILRNGCTQRELRLNGAYYLVLNTCAFDSIAQILMTRGIDDPSYCDYIEHGPKNTTMDFIHHFMKEGATAAVYLHRIALFLSLFGHKVNRRTSNGSISHPHRINMWSSIGEMWMKCFQSRPSVNINYWCHNCGPFTLSQPIFVVRLNKKIEYGSCLLEKAMKSTGLKSRCLKCGATSSAVSNIYNTHLCFEFSVMARADLDGLKCKLEEIPTTLDLEYEYRLCGIISSEAGHFTAFCRKANNCWEEHDDSAWFIKPADPAKRIMVAAAIFTKTGRKNKMWRFKIHVPSDNPPAYRLVP